MQEFYMVWVAGTQGPKVMFATLDKALESAEWLRREQTGREVYVLAPVARLDGRPLLEVRDGISPRRQPVAPAVVVKKKAGRLNRLDG